MSLERIIEALTDIGLTRMQAEVYVYLAKKGPKTIEHLVKTHLFNKKEIRQSLIFLQKNGLISKNQILYCALPFEEALMLLIETKKELAQNMSQNKKELLINWKSNK